MQKTPTFWRDLRYTISSLSLRNKVISAFGGKMRSFQVLAAALVVFSSSYAKGESKTDAVHGKPKPVAAPAGSEEQVVTALTCKNGEVVRKLEVLTKDAGCVTHYTKAGKTEQIAASKRGVDLCKEHLDKVRKALERGGYQCE
jgi:hypothetical protein